MKPALLIAAAALLLGLAPAGIDRARLMDEVPAATLAEYRLFDANGKPAAGLTPYTLATPLFSDYAVKTRYMVLPPGQPAKYTAAGVLDFPVGTTLIKTFAYPADFRQPTANIRKIETRLLIHRAGGWVALDYAWNAAQTEAVLKRAGGRTDVAFIDAAGSPHRIDYAMPNVNQCKQCHAANGAMTPIGPNAANLNVDGQLARLSKAGLVTGVPASPPMMARWDDEHAPVADRARAYLDSNCAHCHNRAGLASNSGLYLGFTETDPTALGVGKHPVAAGRGSGGLAVAIAPGHPEASILVYRLASIEPGVMMPQLGRSVAHEEGLVLIRRYIAEMKP